MPNAPAKLSREQRKESFILLGRRLGELARCLAEDRPPPGSGALPGFFQAALQAESLNPWFTRENIITALRALSRMLEPERMDSWLGSYHLPGEGDAFRQRTVLVVMAGNIPLVGFHDMMCVLLSGHRLLAKTASSDPLLPRALGVLLCEMDPGWTERMVFADGPAGSFDAVIATGSDNSARYFDHYFGKYPHIIRRNRHAAAILTGSESPGELERLGEDVFSYFGLGCRNVSLLWLPEGYDPGILARAWQPWLRLTHHPRYRNNYDFHKAVLTVNKTAHTDTGFCLLRQNPALASPLSVIHWQSYRKLQEAHDLAHSLAGRLQCLVASEVPGSLKALHAGFGQTQWPGPGDYADGVDTMAFLGRL